MLRLVPTLLAPFAVVALLVPTASAQNALTNGDVREVHISQPEGTRIEYFRVDDPSNANLRGAPIGLVRWITGPDPGKRVRDPHAWRSELELILFDKRTRVVHTERVSRARRELVFRELREGSGRTVRCVWTPDQKALCSDASGGEVRYRHFDLRGGAALPLTVVDVVRRGGEWKPGVRVFEPLAASFEAMTPVVSKPIELGTSASERVLDIWRADGLSAGTYRFDGDALLSFSWQAGGPVATAIPTETFERWKAFRATQVEASAEVPARRR